MSRLIDADALCMHLSDWQFGSMTDGKHDAEYEVINKVIDGIEKEPTVDAVQVVRCKDCGAFRKFATKKYEWETDGFCNQTNWCMRDDDYCSDGEREEK